MKWTKIEAHVQWKTVYQGELPNHAAAFWLWKKDSQWYVSCALFDVAGHILIRGAEDDEVAQKEAVRFFAQAALKKAGNFQALWAELAGEI